MKFGGSMDIKTSATEINNSAPDGLETPKQPIDQSKNFLIRRFWPTGEGRIVLGLAIVALIPRIVLATQLDQVTDEGIYIVAGKLYFALITHLRISSPQWYFNYEHPPVVKLLVGLFIYLNAHLGHLLNELQAARHLVGSLLSLPRFVSQSVPGWFISVRWLILI